MVCARMQRKALAGLRAAGIARVVMLTGDDAATAKRIGDVLNLDLILADASPADKVTTVTAEKACVC